MNLIVVLTGNLLVSGEETAASFLKLPSNAMAQSMGGGYTAIGNGIGSLGHNPGGLGFMKTNEIETSIGMYLEGYKIFQIGYGHRLGYGNLGISIMQISANDFEGRDENGYKTSGYKSQDRVITVGIGKAISKAMTLGISGKYINSVIENEKASAIALDAGIIAKSSGKSVPITIGVSARNIGSKMKFIEKAESLPLTLALGISAEILNSCSLIGSMEHGIYDGSLELSGGLNVSVVEHLMLTGSFARGVGSGEVDNEGVINRISGGMGIKMSNYQMDYAFVLMGVLGNIQRISFTFRFGQESGQGTGYKILDRSKKEGRWQKADGRRQRAEGKDKSDIIFVW